MKSFKEHFLSEASFHPIDVFQARWVVTNGEEIYGENGEVSSIERFKKEMQNIKKHNQYDDIYFPTEKMAKDVLDTFKKDGFKNLKVQKMSYSKE